MSVKIVFLIVTIFLSSIGYGVILPALPFLSERIGASPFQLGIAFSIFAVASFLTGPLWGMLADRISRKSILIIGILGYGMTSALLGMTSTITSLLIIRFLSGCFVGAIQPASYALASDYTPPENRARIFGYIAAMNGIGFIVGPVVGSMLSPFGVSIPFFGVGLLSILCGLFAFWVLPTENKPEAQHSKKRVKVKINLGAFPIRKVSPFFIGAFLFAFIDASLFATLAFFVLQHLQSSETIVGWLFAIIGATAACLQVFVLAKIHKKLGETFTIAFGFIVGAIGFFLLGMSSALAIAIVSLIFIGFCHGLAHPTLSSAISLRLPKHQLGTGFGFLQTASSLGRAVGPLVGGALFTIDFRFPFFLSGSIVCLFVVFYLVLHLVLRDSTSTKQNANKTEVKGQS